MIDKTPSEGPHRGFTSVIGAYRPHNPYRLLTAATAPKLMIVFYRLIRSASSADLPGRRRRCGRDRVAEEEQTRLTVCRLFLYFVRNETQGASGQPAHL